MARPRTPTAVLELKGAFKKHPERKKERASEPPPGNGLGDPPLYFDDAQKVVWNEYKQKAAWLTDADAIIVELASVLLWRFRADPLAMQSADLGQLKNCLSLMGLTPSDRSKIAVPQQKQESNRFAKRAAELSNVIPFKK